MRREALSKGQSDRNFRRGNGVHPKNVRSNPMRGGIRL